MLSSVQRHNSLKFLKDYYLYTKINCVFHIFEQSAYLKLLSTPVTCLCDSSKDTNTSYASIALLVALRASRNAVTFDSYFPTKRLNL